MDKNTLDFGIGQEYGLDFVEKGHSIANPKDYGSTSMSGHTLTVMANRDGNPNVATQFGRYIGGPGHCTACRSNDDFPDLLNFAVNGTFTITTPDKKMYSNTVAVAQGHKFGVNNWWIGGKQMYGKAVGTPVAVAVFHRCDDAEDLREKTDATIGNIAQAVSDAVENLFTTIANNLNADDFLKKVNGKIDEKASNICAEIDNSIIADKQSVKDFVQKLADDLKTLMSTLVNDTKIIQNYIISIGEKVSENINKLINDSGSNINKELCKVLSKIIYAAGLLFVRFDGSKSTSNYFSMSIIGYQIIDELNK